MVIKGNGLQQNDPKYVESKRERRTVRGRVSVTPNRF